MNKELSAHVTVKMLTDICVARGVENIVLSAGSRNAPLIISFVRRKEFKTYSITDERSAAFFALGMAEKSKKPTALICTSGTALLNYAPAAAEAYYKGIPLVIVSADRPAEKLNHGDGQMIRQEGALSNFTKFTCSLPKINDSQDVWYAKTLLERAFTELYKPKRGPVHINIPLREPLYKTKQYHDSFRFTDIYLPEKVLSKNYISELSRQLAEYSKIMIIPAVAGDNDELSRLLDELSHLPQFVVITETINNIKGEKIFTGTDKYVAAIEEHPEAYPELVITMGDILISRKIKKILDSDLLKAHWHINESGNYIDMFQRMTALIEVSPEYLLRTIDIQENEKSDYALQWRAIKEEIEERHNKFAELKVIQAKEPIPCKWSDFKVFDVIKDYLTEDIEMYCGNSTVIRYAQLFDEYFQVKNYCNRGTSGIDGCLSTALGSSLESQKISLAVIGDLSFYYDSNALWNKYIHKKFKVILINNEGGGIFRFIDGPSGHPELEYYFENHQKRTAADIARAYGLLYYYCDTEEYLRDVMPDFLYNEYPAILEIRTPRDINDKILKEYFKIYK